ncbi:MAG: hypothetical protein IKO27_03640 [Ruminococcus sp.]|nr:hypothetical protein [Ruminococcus sp.]
MRLRPILLCALCSAALLCGCEEEAQSSSVPEEKPPAQTASSPAAPVEVRNYSFPGFMKDSAVTDMLAKVDSRSFDSKAADKQVEVSPFEKYDCDRCFAEIYYSFKDKGKVGIINSNGTVIIEPEKYVSAKLVSNDLILLSYPEKSGKQPDLLYINDGYGTFISSEEAAKVDIVAMQAEDNLPVEYTLSVRGTSFDRNFDSIEKTDPSQIKTDKLVVEAYKATSGNRTYFLILDEYQNITVCEAPYALVRVKVGGEYGECYILDGDHYTELEKMIKSFGSESSSVRPSKDESLDYLQIVRGLNTGNQSTITMSPDGFCLTDEVSDDGTVRNKYFSLYPKETFVDLVNWVSEVVAGEYIKK